MANERILVAGAGAIGGYMAAYLARSGVDVVAIDSWPEHVETIRRDGMRVAGLTDAENFSTPVRALHVGEIASLMGEAPFDWVLLAVKSYDTDWMTHLVTSVLAPNGCVVSLQNGLNELQIASVVGLRRTMGCVVARVSAELMEPGFVRRTTPLGGKDYVSFRVGEPTGIGSERARKLAALVGKADSADVTTNLWGERWSKLVVNAMRNGLSAAAALSGNERDLDPLARAVSVALGSESVLVGRALGYPLTDIAGLAPDDVVGAAAGDPTCNARLSEILIRGARARSDLQRPSMAQDISRGRRTETDSINGLVARLGREVGVPTPVNEAVPLAVQAIEKRLAKPNRELVKQLSTLLDPKVLQ